MFPHVTLTTDRELDVHMTLNFLGWSMGGVSFNESIYEPNPDFKEIDVENKQAVEAYFEKTYLERQAEINAAITLFQAGWNKVEDQFFALTRQIFHGKPFPGGKYEGYISITNCNPRFLEDKSFMIFYLTQTPNRIISHELMHFMFYDYSVREFPELFGDADPNSGAYWSLAELFNNVLLSFSDFQFLNNQGDRPYPEHEQYYQPLVDLWNKDRDVDKFIPAAFELLRDKK